MPPTPTYCPGSIGARGCEIYPAKCSEEEPNFHERQLRPGEIEITRAIFGAGIDYQKVLVHNHGTPWFLGLQKAHTAVTPNGELYFLKEDYQCDFSKADDWRQQWFIHEMTHVWQYQLGYPIKAVGLIPQNRKYVLDKNKLISEYNMEQQGDIIADYFYLKKLKKATAYNEPQYTQSDIPLYEKILKQFISNPKEKSNLPPKGDEKTRAYIENSRQGIYTN